MKKYCCEKLDYLIKDAKTAIGYNEIFREYYIDMKKSEGIQTIMYCPFCGNKLPKSLRNLWFDILEDEFNIEDVVINNNKIPIEFKSSEWWLNRNL